MLGAKTITSLVFVGLTVALSAVAGLFELDRLSHLTLEACLIAGLFASVGGIVVGRFWRVDRPSRGYIGVRRGAPRDSETTLARLSRNRLVVGSDPEVTPRDMPAMVQRASYALIFLCLGLTAFTNRATELLTRVPDQVADLSLSSYCTEQRASETATPVPRLVETPGCALVLRAYRLGYTKKLGTCAPKEVAAEAKNKREVCTARRPDEPLLHYAWRVLGDEVDSARASDPTGSLRASLRDFELQLGYLRPLLENQAHAVGSSPRSSHHVWTNLPDPRPTSWVGRTLTPESCTSRFSDFPVRVTWKDAANPTAAVLDHALGQLLFSPRFGPTVGYCREYTVHWGAPADACQRLAADPAAFLDSAGALRAVRDVIGRHRSLRDLRDLTSDLGRKQVAGPLMELQRVVSFNCFMIDPAGKNTVSNRKVSLGGAALALREIRGPAFDATGAGQVETYMRIAALLTGGTRYAGPMTERPIQRARNAPPAPTDLAGDDYRLTKLEMLRESDPFVGAAWPLGVDNLTEVYPFHVHIQHFSDVFRRTYKRQRGRL